MISLDQYVGPHAKSKDWTTARQDNALALLSATNKLLRMAEDDGVKLPINPKTGSQVSGVTFGGFRPQDCPQGRPESSHKQGQGVDVFDPANALDNWITKKPQVLVECGLYREHPDDTNTWCHLTTRAPGSGRRTFKP